MWPRIAIFIVSYFSATYSQANICGNNGFPLKQCVKIKDCLSLLEGHLPLTSPLSNKVISILKESHCGFKDRIPKVCCPTKVTVIVPVIDQQLIDEIFPNQEMSHSEITTHTFSQNGQTITNHPNTSNNQPGIIKQPIPQDSWLNPDKSNSTFELNSSNNSSVIIIPKLTNSINLWDLLHPLQISSELNNNPFSSRNQVPTTIEQIKPSDPNQWGIESSPHNQSITLNKHQKNSSNTSENNSRQIVMVNPDKDLNQWGTPDQEEGSKHLKGNDKWGFPNQNTNTNGLEIKSDNQRIANIDSKNSLRQWVDSKNTSNTSNQWGVPEEISNSNNQWGSSNEWSNFSEPDNLSTFQIQLDNLNGSTKEMTSPRPLYLPDLPLPSRFVSGDRVGVELPNLSGVTGHKNYNILPVDCGQSKQINGQTDIFKHPWMALIAQNTPASCISGEGTVAGIRVGEYDISKDEDCDNDGKNCAPPTQDFAVDGYYVHDEFNKETMQNNIGLIRVSRPINFTRENATPICLPVDDQQVNLVLEGKTMVVTGWPDEGGVKKNKLEEKQFELISYLRCDELMTGKNTVISDKQVCTEKISSCSPNFGGPLMMSSSIGSITSYLQHGIVSHIPENCTTSVKSVLTRVSPYMNWILDKIEF